jgi:hypothetical protein
MPALPAGWAADPSATLSQKSKDAQQIATTVDQSGHVSILVEFTLPASTPRPSPDPSTLAALKAHVRSAQNAIVADHFGDANNPTPGRGFERALRRFENSPMFSVNVNKAELQALAADPRVARIHYNALRQTKLIQSVPLIGMNSAYIAGATGTGRAVASIDTGVQSGHAFLNGKVILEACFSNNAGGGGGVSLCPDGSSTQTGPGSASPTVTQCQNGASNLCIHGTHVAGIAAGNNTTPNNPLGSPSSGVAKGAQIVAIQVFTRFNSGCPTNPCILAFDSDILAGLDYVFGNMASLPGGAILDAVNMSLGGGSFTSPCDSSVFKSQIDNLLAAGVASAVAAGNDGSTNAVSEPACVSTAIAVGSSDKSDVISGFTNMASMVALMGPGGFGGGSCQFGANNPDILGPIPTNLYACLAGTSMATPHVAGAFAAMRSAAPKATVAQILGTLQNTGVPIVDTRAGGTQTKPRIRVDLALNQLTSSNMLAAVLPYARSVQIGEQASAFASIINAGVATATNCSVSLPNGLLGSFVYQTTDVSNQLTGSPNTPVNIATGATQHYVFGYTPSVALSSVEIGMVFSCTNMAPAPSISGVNTFIVSASSTPTPDIIAIAATQSNDGITNISGNAGSGFFAAAGINIGTAATITASADDGGRGLPLTLTICQTDPNTAACLSPPAASTTTTFNVNSTLTYTVFVQGNGNIPFDPARNRLFLRFKDGGGVTRGATNVAVRTFGGGIASAH